MAKRSITGVDVSGKRVLMRVDFNVPMEGGVISDDRRIRMALPSIRSVIDRGGRLALMSHLGRPSAKGYEKEFSLEACAVRLGELLGKKVAFPSHDCADGAAAAAVNAMKNGDVVMLENVRFHEAEENKKKTADQGAHAARLAPLGDIYCNDAFGTCHRKDASMVAVPKAMKAQGKACVCGLLVEKEIRYLHGALETPRRPFYAVLGGAKVSDKIGTIDRLLAITDGVIVGGAMAYTFLKAQGASVGASRVEEDRLADAKRMLDAAQAAGKPLHLPTDHVCAKAFEENPAEVRTFTGAIEAGWMGLDIGPATRAAYAALVSNAGTVVWNGPMGVFEFRPFATGTQQVAKAIADATKSGATSIVGGGDSAAAVEKFGLAAAMSHVSTGGGASLEMLEGKHFESIDVLDNM